MQDNEREWRYWVEKERPEMEDLPCGYTKLLDPFRRLLLVRAWCPDRMLHMAEVYVRHSLGSEFIDAPLLDLEVLLLVNFALCFFFAFYSFWLISL